MDECPWCDEPLDLEEIYREHDLNDDGYFECPHCGKQFAINQEISYTYSAEMGPAISQAKIKQQAQDLLTPAEYQRFMNYANDHKAEYL